MVTALFWHNVTIDLCMSIYMEGHWCYRSIGHGAQAICYIPLSIDNIPGLHHDTIYQSGRRPGYQVKTVTASEPEGESESFTTDPYDIAQYRATYCQLVDGIWIYVAPVDIVTAEPIIEADVATELARPDTYIERLMSWIYGKK